MSCVCTKAKSLEPSQGFLQAPSEAGGAHGGRSGRPRVVGGNVVVAGVGSKPLGFASAGQVLLTCTGWNKPRSTLNTHQREMSEPSVISPPCSVSGRYRPCPVAQHGSLGTLGGEGHAVFVREASNRQRERFSEARARGRRRPWNW